MPVGIVQADSWVGLLSDLPVGQAATYQNTGTKYDYAIGGLPFLSGVTHGVDAGYRTFPLTRETADYTKTQIDQGSDPGEQTLVNWWLRSQTSFHAGTGIVFEEEDSSDTTNTIPFRFQDSAGVDVWTPGKVTLLPATSQVMASAGACRVMGANDSSTGNDLLFQAQGSTLTRYQNGATATVTWGGAGTILSMCNDGTNYYVADSVGVWSGPLANTSSGTKQWNTGSSNVVVGWVKQRLVAGIGPSFYQLVGGTAPTLPTPLYTHPLSTWVWTSITESPSSIMSAGYVGSNSMILTFTLESSGDVPTLTGGAVGAQLPEGELIMDILGYLGSYVGILTTRGIRVATVDTSSNLQYGSLSYNTPPGATISGGLVGRDHFLLAAVGNGITGDSGLVRLDLGLATAYDRFATANDLQAHIPGLARSVTLYGNSDRLALSVDNAGTYLQSTTALEETGFLKTGNIRYHMLEPKLYKFVRARTLPLTAGSLSITANDHAGVATSLVTFNAGAEDPLDEVSLPVNYGPQEFISLTFTLGRDQVFVNTGPTFTSYQLKSLPAQKRQRNLVLPLLCFDFEGDGFGGKSGYEGAALDKLIALETMEELGDVVLFQDLSRDPNTPRLVVIDNITFTQTDAPSAQQTGWGGRIMVTLRTVT